MDLFSWNKNSVSAYMLSLHFFRDLCYNFLKDNHFKYGTLIKPNNFHVNLETVKISSAFQFTAS